MSKCAFANTILCAAAETAVGALVTARTTGLLAGVAMPIQRANVNFDEPSSRCWARLDFDPAGSDVATNGTGGLDRTVGIFSVNLIYPTGIGDGIPRAEADSICSAFKAGSYPDLSGNTVVVNASTAGGARIVDNTYRITVTVEWQADSARS